MHKKALAGRAVAVFSGAALIAQAAFFSFAKAEDGR
jgi:hypothetical protein